METQLLNAGLPGTIEQAAKLIRIGQVIAFPTDTLYGVGVDPFNSAAIDLLYQIKGRPAEKGIPILLAEQSDLDKVAIDIPLVALALIEAYWPGPLTLIVPKHSKLPDTISPNAGIAVRIPDHAVSRAFIKAAGGVVATSSANHSGEAPARNATEVLAALQGQIAAVLDGGPVLHGQGSTILDCMSNPPKVLREGPITAKNLSQLTAIRT